MCPWEEMLEQLKADAPEPRAKAPRRAAGGAVAAGDLRLRGPLHPAAGGCAGADAAGAATQARSSWKRSYFVDAEPNLGQPVAQALAPTSEFRSRLAALKPQGTTVTIWVYPDSFDDFRTIKAELFKLGYLTAGRPLPDGHPIGGVARRVAVEAE